MSSPTPLGTSMRRDPRFCSGSMRRTCVVARVGDPDRRPRRPRRPRRRCRTRSACPTPRARRGRSRCQQVVARRDDPDVALAGLDRGRATRRPRTGRPCARPTSRCWMTCRGRSRPATRRPRRRPRRAARRRLTGVTDSDFAASGSCDSESPAAPTTSEQTAATIVTTRQPDRTGTSHAGRERRAGGAPATVTDPVDQAHRDEQQALGLAGLVHRDDVLVIQGSRQPRLALEPLAEARVVGDLGRDHLQGDRPVGRAESPGRRRPSPPGDDALDAVPSEGGTGLKAVDHLLAYSVPGRRTACDVRARTSPTPPDPGRLLPGPAPRTRVGRAMGELRSASNWPATESTPSPVAVAWGSSTAPRLRARAPGRAQAHRGRAGQRRGLPRALQARVADSGLVRHPNVVTVYRAGEEGGLLYIAMDYIEGTDLKAMLAEHGPARASARRGDRGPGRIRPRRRARSRLVHRDVKPGERLIAARGSATTRTSPTSA